MQRKPYNPNTAYGRKKILEQAQNHVNNLPKEEKIQLDTIKIVVFIIICFIAWLILGTEGFLKWATK